MTAVQKIESVNEPIGFLAVIEKAIFDANTPLDKLDRLLDIQERVMRKNSETEFNIALSDMQPNLPIIEKEGKAHNNIKYAKYEDVMEAISPSLGQYGFSISFEAETSNNVVTITGTLAHRAGHSKKVSLPLNLDKSGNKQDIHAMGSTLSYGRRYVVSLLLNIVTRDEDDDGSKATKNATITEEQERIIDEWISETNSNRDAFLKTYKVEKICDLPAIKFDGIIATFKAKKAKA